MIDISARKIFWLCQYSTAHKIHKNSFLMSAIWCIKFGIWEAKLSKKIPSNMTLCMEVVSNLSGIYKSSQKIRDEKDLNNFFICSNWDEVRRRW